MKFTDPMILFVHKLVAQEGGNSGGNSIIQNNGPYTQKIPFCKFIYYYLVVA